MSLADLNLTGLANRPTGLGRTHERRPAPPGDTQPPATTQRPPWANHGRPSGPSTYSSVNRGGSGGVDNSFVSSWEPFSEGHLLING